MILDYNIDTNALMDGARLKALELANVAAHQMSTDELVARADAFYRFLSGGKKGRRSAKGSWRVVPAAKRGRKAKRRG